MVDLIVHTAGGTIQNVSGVNEATTCTQIVYALAHATQQKGRFTLIARLEDPSSQEHRFTPNERPFEFMQECARQGVKVEFELRKLGDGSEQREAGTGGSETPNVLSSTNSSLTSLAEEAAKYNRPNSADRPPPPDYNLVMTDRCNSLRRYQSSAKKTQSPLTFLQIPNFSLQDLYSHNFSRMDLEALIDIQEKTLAAQKDEMVRMELSLDSNERELVQLRKQHNNLQTVLASLRNGNWPTRVETEKFEAERLNTAIAAMRTALAEKRRELHEAVQLQMTVQTQFDNELSRNRRDEGAGQLAHH